MCVVEQVDSQVNNKNFVELALYVHLNPIATKVDDEIQKSLKSDYALMFHTVFFDGRK
jgi:hypothetical protein